MRETKSLSCIVRRASHLEPRGHSGNTSRPTFWPLGMRSWREFGEGLEIRVIEGELLLRWGQLKDTARMQQNLPSSSPKSRHSRSRSILAQLLG